MDSEQLRALEVLPTSDLQVLGVLAHGNYMTVGQITRRLHDRTTASVAYSLQVLRHNQLIIALKKRENSPRRYSCRERASVRKWLGDYRPGLLPSG